MECRPDYTGGMERTLPQGHDARRPRPPAQTDHEWESVSLTSIGTSHGRCYSPATSVASPRPHPSRSALRNQYLAASDQQAPSYAPHMAQIATPSPQRPPHAYARRDLGVAPASNVGPLEGSGTLRNSSTPQSALHQNNQGYDLSVRDHRCLSVCPLLGVVLRRSLTTILICYVGCAKTHNAEHRWSFNSFTG